MKTSNGPRLYILAFLTYVVFWAIFPSLGHSVEPNEKLADPVLEKRARAISKDLRCLVCQNENIDDSHADLARDLRLLIRDRLKAGDSNQDVIEYVRERYGDFVLMTPPVQKNTYLLWFAPLGLLLCGAGLLYHFYFRQRKG